jgi:hypothetical protein
VQPRTPIRPQDDPHAPDITLIPVELLKNPPSASGVVATMRA